MAKDTALELRNTTIYSIFLRNYSEEGTFKAVQKDLDRIKTLGTDVIWFLPFYPIGEKNKKGTVGSPYAIKDYRAVDPAHGSLDDFKTLVEEIHKREMKVMIDIVFNHTAPDSVLVREHPEWFFRKENGEMGNQVGEWTDIVDLDYVNKALWSDQIETLVQWAKIVDGFRCDVAPLVPIEFWLQARAEVAKIKPSFIWLAESIERDFLQYLRSENVRAHSDGEMFQAFDLSYDYDIYTEFKDYILGDVPLSKYVHVLNLQDSTYPANYVKMKFLENHDQERIAALVDTIENIKQWTAFLYLQKGATLLYNGQEVLAKPVPSLFEKDVIDWETGYDLSTYMAHLDALKKEHVPIQNDRYHLEADDASDTVKIYFENKNAKKVGVFNLKENEGQVHIDVADGTYRNLINNESIEVNAGQVDLTATPAFFIVN